MAETCNPIDRSDIDQTAEQIVDIADWPIYGDYEVFPEGARDKSLRVSPESAPYPFCLGGHRYLFKEAIKSAKNPGRPRHPDQYWAELIAFRTGRLRGERACWRRWRTDMNRFIEHLVEPHRLLLCWQARESSHRSRYCVGQLIKSGDGIVRLQYDVGSEEFSEARELGFQGYPAFPLPRAEHCHQVLEAFVRRLPPRSRRDFSRYLELRAISPDADISDFALLGYSGAKLPNDGFELVHPFDEPPVTFEMLLEVAGFRYEAEIEASMLQPGNPVCFVSEPDNSHDGQAIRIECRSRKLGYVPRGQLGLLHRMIDRGARLDGTIFRVNGTGDRPLVYALMRITQPRSAMADIGHAVEV